MTRPPSTSATGYGTPERSPSPASTATAKSRKTKSSISATASLKPVVVDARGLRCPLPLVRARVRRWPSMAPGEALVVLATDPEAPIDLGALAADAGRAFSAERGRTASGG